MNYFETETKISFIELAVKPNDKNWDTYEIYNFIVEANDIEEAKEVAKEYSMALFNNDWIINIINIKFEIIYINQIEDIEIINELNQN